MDERPAKRKDAQQDEAHAFSMKLGNDIPEQPTAPVPAVNAPPPLTPTPTPTPTSAPQAPTPRTPPQPQYPRFDSYPSSTGSMPPQTGAPGYQGAPGYPLPQGMPAQPSQPMVPMAPPQVGVLGDRKSGALGRPLPLPVALLVGLGCFVLLAIVFAVRVLALGGDWAEGASTVGIVALALVATTAVAAALRFAAGRRSLGFALLSLVLLVALAVTGVAGLASSAQLHQAQAQTFEKNGQWSAAIYQYGLTGQKGPNAPDIARVQNAWGEQLLKQGDYQGALTHFQAVLDDYQQSGAEVARAQTGQFQAYVAWLKNDPNHVPYREAITVFVNYASNSACASDCKTTLAEVTPQAYFLYGTQLLSQKRYQAAITQFGKVTSQYKSSSYAKQAHAKAATAYLAYGQQQITSQDCSGAVTTYKTLVASYKDTPEAGKAQNALSAPQDVSGFIVNAPGNPASTMHLSKQMNFKAFFFSNEYSTSIDGKTGQFIFKLVAQGTYYLTLSHPVSNGTDYYAWWIDSAHTKYYTVTVTPLCKVQIPTISM